LVAQKQDNMSDIYTYGLLFH